jgi:hypothetical protein
MVVFTKKSMVQAPPGITYDDIRSRYIAALKKSVFIVVLAEFSGTSTNDAYNRRAVAYVKKIITCFTSFLYVL